MFTSSGVRNYSCLLEALERVTVYNWTIGWV